MVETFSTLEFFTTNQWRFISNNSFHLLDVMSIKEQEIFYFDVRKINWQNYFDSYVLGVKNFVLKEDLSTLPLARSNLKRYYYQIDLLR